MSDEIMQRVQSRAMDTMKNIKDSIQCGTKHIVQTGPAGRKNVYEKLRILSDAAKYDVACTSSGVDRETAAAPGSAIVFPLTGDVSRCSRSFIRMSVYLTANIVSTVRPMLWSVLPSHRRKCAA